MMAAYSAKPTNILDIFIVVFLLPTTLAMSHWFLNLLPNQAGAAWWTAPAWFGKRFGNH
jgi:hypothetical protein